MENPDYSTIIQKLVNCVAACENCAAACLGGEDVKMVADYIRLDRGCADI